MEILLLGRLDPSGGGGGGIIGPPERTWVGVGTKPLATLCLGGIKILGPPDGLWAGLEIEVLRSLYPGGSDGIYLEKGGVPIGA
jgi:hypothetical protein